MMLLHIARWLDGLLVYRSSTEPARYYRPSGHPFGKVVYVGRVPESYWPEYRSSVREGWTFYIEDHPAECKDGAYLRYEGWFPDAASAEKALIHKMRRFVIVLSGKPEKHWLDAPHHRQWLWLPRRRAP